MRRLAAFLALGVYLLRNAPAFAQEKRSDRRVLLAARVYGPGRQIDRDFDWYSFARYWVFRRDQVITEHFSGNGRFDVVTALKARALVLKDGRRTIWTVPWPQDAPPFTVLVTDDGRRTVLLGTHHAGNHGEIGGNQRELVILNEKGELLSALNGHDLEAGAPGSTEPVMAVTKWLNYAQESVGIDPATYQFRFMRWMVDKRQLGNLKSVWVPIAFDLETGNQVELFESEIEQMRAPLREAMRRKLRSGDSGERMDAADDAGALKDQASVPQLIKLLDDTSTTLFFKLNGRTWRDVHGVRVAAALSLASLLGKDAFPILRERLHKAQGKDREEWAAVLESLGESPDERG